MKCVKVGIIYCLVQYRAMGAKWHDLICEFFKLIFLSKYRADEIHFFKQSLIDEGEYNDSGCSKERPE